MVEEPTRTQQQFGSNQQGERRNYEANDKVQGSNGQILLQEGESEKI